ncbi:MAG TPA: hypothetical protein VNA25_25785 [Phycisphaerae bacterium]|nr:hypothetical protein [Phycisphaerae bacterium]
MPAPEKAARRLDRSSVDRWRSTCPVLSEHKSVFPTVLWLWQPGAAAWVWGVLKAAGGNMQAEELTQHLARLRDLSRQQATGLRNRGLTVLEAFRLVEVERFPAVRGGRETSVYGNVRIVQDKIDKKDARRRKQQAEDDMWIEVLRQALTPTEDHSGHSELWESET